MASNIEDKYDKGEYRASKKESVEERKKIVNPYGVIYPTSPLQIIILFFRTCNVLVFYSIKLVIFSIWFILSFDANKKILVSWTGGHPDFGWSGEHYGYINPLKFIIQAREADYFEETNSSDDWY
jgi:hypothetical protein